MTSKKALAAATLVAAVPAGVLGYFLVSTFLSPSLGHSEFTMALKALYGVTLALCAAIVFLPFGVLIFGPKAAPRAIAPKGPSEAKQTAKSAKEGEADSEESLEPSPSGFDMDEPHEKSAEAGLRAATSTGELEVVEAAMSRDDLGAISQDDLSAFEDFDAGDSKTDAIPTDDFALDEDEDDKPKKKKR